MLFNHTATKLSGKLEHAFLIGKWEYGDGIENSLERMTLRLWFFHLY